MSTRCKKGTRRNKKTGNCEMITPKSPKVTKTKVVVKTAKTKVVKALEKDECPICLKALNKSIITTHCNHTFHKSCLKKQCTINHSCPLCRVNIYKDCNIKHHKLTAIEINRLVLFFVDLDDFSRDDFGAEQKWLKNQLKKLKYDPDFNLPAQMDNNLYNQALKKMIDYRQNQKDIFGEIYRR